MSYYAMTITCNGTDILCLIHRTVMPNQGDTQDTPLILFSLHKKQKLSHLMHTIFRTALLLQVVYTDEAGLSQHDVRKNELGHDFGGHAMLDDNKMGTVQERMDEQVYRILLDKCYSCLSWRHCPPTCRRHQTWPPSSSHPRAILRNTHWR